MRQNEARRRNALLQFIKEPSAENYSNAFYIVRTPSLKYDIFAGDYAFVSDKFPQLLNNIFEIYSRLKTIITYISDANRFGDIGASKKTAEQINLAKMLLISLDDFHRNCNWLIFYIDHLLQCIKVYNCSYFFQKLVLINGCVEASFRGVSRSRRRSAGSRCPAPRRSRRRGGPSSPPCACRSRRTWCA